MYKLILLTEEVEVRSSIQEVLEKENLCFEMCGVFYNSYEALDFIDIHKDIDVLIIDIKTIYDDNIELVTFFKNKFPLTKIITLVRMQELTHVQDILKYNIVYITKPMERQNFLDVLLSIKKELDEETKLYLNIENLENYKKESNEILIENALNLLIKETLDDYLIQTLHFLNLSFNDKEYVVFSIRLEEEKNVSQLEYKLVVLKKIIEETMTKKMKYVTFNHKNKKVGIVQSLTNEFNFRLLDELLNEIVIKMQRYYKCKTCIGVSLAKCGLENIKELYRQCSHALMRQNILKGSQINYYQMINEKKDFAFISEDSFKKLRYLIRYKSLDEIQVELIDLKNDCKNISNLHVFNFMLLEISSSLLKCVEDINDFIQRYTKDIYETLKDLHNLDDIFNEIQHIIKTIKISNDKNIQSTIQFSSKKVMDYLQTNYSNPNLNLDMLAEALNISVSYLCALLKKEKNGTFVKILTDIRMKKAIELLENSNIKIVEIAEKVGFTEPYYFSHSFKKYTGYSPKEFKKAKAK